MESKQPPRHILIVEDHPMNRKVLVFMLKKHNCRIDVATNGREAVEMAAQNRYDLIIMDCQMPEMDGMEATRAIREQEGAVVPDSTGTTGSPTRTPIIALTACTESSIREKCVESGMDDIFGKPYQLDLLTHLLEKWAPLSPETATPSEDKNVKNESAVK